VYDGVCDVRAQKIAVRTRTAPGQWNAQYFETRHDEPSEIGNDVVKNVGHHIYHKGTIRPLFLSQTIDGELRWIRVALVAKINRQSGHTIALRCGG